MGSRLILRAISGRFLAAGRCRIALAAFGAVLGIAVFCIAAYAAWLGVNNNFHVVVQNELYRSGQPSPDTLADYARTLGIKTIVNLRGANPGKPWYDGEVAQSRALGLTLVDFRMKAGRGLTREEAVHLVSLLQSAQKPILVHCQSGADRAGLAAALYLAGVKGASEAQAEAQLSVRYGHVPLPIFPGFAMDKSFEAVEDHFGYRGS